MHRRQLSGLLFRFSLWPLLSLGLPAQAQLQQTLGPVVTLVLSDASPAYQEASAAIVTELARGGVTRQQVQQVMVAEWPGSASEATSRVVLTLGVDASRVLARSEVKAPVLSGLVPRQGFERIVRDSGRRVSPQFSAVYLDQPLARQIDFLRLVVPTASRMGVLLGPESRGQLPALEELTPARGLKLARAELKPGDAVFDGLRKILPESDVLLALPDPLIYNSGSIQNILLTSYRAQVPMLAFSPAYVRAGALAALYVTPTQAGQQLGALARGVLQGRPLPLPQYPQDFSMGVNEHVAQSLGLTIDTASVLERLRRLEKTP